MNELHRVFVHIVRVGGKDIELKIVEEYASENREQPIAIKVIGPNGLQSGSVEGMLKLLEVAPRYLLSEENASEPAAPVASSARASNKVLSAGESAHQNPETGPHGIVEDAFDSLAGGSPDLQIKTEPAPPETSSQPKATGSWKTLVCEGKLTDEDMGDLTRDFNGGREHSARLQKFEREHPFLWKEYDEALENGKCEPSGVITEMKTVWYAENTKLLRPELYAAALDPKKYKEYMDKNDFWSEDLPEWSEDVTELDLPEEADSVASDAPRCQFVKADGTRCGSPALQRKRFCHFHSKTADGRKRGKSRGAHRGHAGSVSTGDDKSVSREVPVIEVPVLEDDLAIQMAVTNICRQLANDSLEPKRASTLLYGLQVASIAVRRTALNRRERKA